MSDFTRPLWLLKLGAPLNLFFLVQTLGLRAEGVDPHIVVPAQILFAVSAYRCLFPCRYKDQVVLHDTWLSSVFLTRVLATFAEVAFIYQLSHVLRVLNLDRIGWVDALSWLMVVQVSVSQVCVWGAILTDRLVLYYYEELGWAVLIVANTLASLALWGGPEGLGGEMGLLGINLIFGAVYLPWQLFHLRALRTDARENAPATSEKSLGEGLHGALFARTPRTDAGSWGGLVGLTWMLGYWALLIPPWVHQIVRVFRDG